MRDDWTCSYILNLVFPCSNFISKVIHAWNKIIFHHNIFDEISWAFSQWKLVKTAHKSNKQKFINWSKWKERQETFRSANFLNFAMKTDWNWVVCVCRCVMVDEIQMEFLLSIIEFPKLASFSVTLGENLIRKLLPFVCVVMKTSESIMFKSKLKCLFSLRKLNFAENKSAKWPLDIIEGDDVILCSLCIFNANGIRVRVYQHKLYHFDFYSIRVFDGNKKHCHRIPFQFLNRKLPHFYSFHFVALPKSCSTLGFSFEFNSISCQSPSMTRVWICAD